MGTPPKMPRHLDSAPEPVGPDGEVRSSPVRCSVCDKPMHRLEAWDRFRVCQTCRDYIASQIALTDDEEP